MRPGTGRKVEVVSEEAARLLLDGVAAQQVTLQQQIALKIRAELVCCDIYQICADSLWPTPQRHWEDWQVIRSKKLWRRNYRNTNYHFRAARWQHNKIIGQIKD